jgi:uncharacterized membrane protein (UPF0127 family)
MWPVIQHPARALVRRSLACTVAVAVLVLAAACGDDDESGDDPPAGTETPGTNEGAAGDDATDAADSTDPLGATAAPLSLDELAAASGGAPAAAGAGLDEAPGPAERSAVPGVGEVAASVTDAEGNVTGCCLMVAATDEQRQRGLMEVTDLGGYQGMVFVWDQDTQGGFWMRNTPTPLSIAWFDADGAYVSSTDMEPCAADSDDCPTYPPAGPYRFAVEVFQGELEDLGVGPGSRLALGGDCARAG